MLTSKVEVVINCAASTDFNMELEQATIINIEGALRMQDLAKECENINIFSHVSTAYVNCDNTNTEFLNSTPEAIVEKNNFDAEETYLFLKSKSSKYLNDNEASIIGTYPNTYTFTKNISE